MRLYVPSSLALLAQWHASGVIPSTDEAFLPEDDAEESEYGALMAAADASRALGASRRVVVVVETPREGEVPMSDAVAVHADTVDDADDDEELGWFATQEIPDLLA